MNIIDVQQMDPEISFKIKTESYLYVTAKTMLEYNRGDRERLVSYMDDRLKKIESLSKQRRPFRVVDDGNVIMEVE